MKPALQVVRAGCVDYARGLALQAELVARVRAGGGAPGFLILCEHEPVYTLGRNADERHMAGADGDIPVVRTDRGGQVTYHGPGQLVGYPILALRRFDLTVRRLVCTIEGAVADALEAYGIPAEARGGTAGLWVGARKIASVGLRIAAGVSSHGFALNANNDLTPFTRIHPCGLVGQEMTSVARELGRAVRIDELGSRVARALRRRLGARREFANEPRPEGSRAAPGRVGEGRLG